MILRAIKSIPDVPVGWGVGGIHPEREAWPGSAVSVSLSRQTVEWRPDKREMNWKYLLAYLTLLSSTSHGQEEEEEEEEERMCGEGLVWCADPLTPYPHHIIKNINSSHPVWPHLTRRRRQVEERNQENHKHFQHACETIDDLIVPRAGRNKQNKWRYILNSEDSRPELQQVMMMMMMRMIIME